MRTVPQVSTAPVLDRRNFSSDDIHEAFAANTFRESVAIAAERLDEMLRRRTVEGVTLEHPELLLKEARSLMSAADGEVAFSRERFSKIVDLYIRTGIHVGSTGYMARQFSSVFPISAVFDMVTAMAPQPASFYEAGQLANVADKIIAEEFARLLGWNPEACDMITTSGGTLANPC